MEGVARGRRGQGALALRAAAAEARRSYHGSGLCLFLSLVVWFRASTRVTASSVTVLFFDHVGVSVIVLDVVRRLLPAAAFREEEGGEQVFRAEPEATHAQSACLQPRRRPLPRHQ